MNDFRALIARLKSHPPETAKELAIRARELWRAYPKKRRAQILSKSHRRHFPELALSHRHVGLLEALLNAEATKLDVGPCWQALDNRVPPDLVQKAFQGAKRRIREDPGLDFVTVQATLLAEVKISPPEQTRSDEARTPLPDATETQQTSPPPKKERIRKSRARPAAVHRPTLYILVATVMGRDTIGIPEIIRRLKARRWVPASKDVAAYMSLTLSSNTNVFERVERGVYKVANSYVTPTIDPAYLGVPPRKTSRVTLSSTTATATTTEKPKPEPARHPPSGSDSSIPRVVITFEGANAEWIIQRSTSLRAPPKAFFESLIKADIRAVLAQLNGRSPPAARDSQ